MNTPLPAQMFNLAEPIPGYLVQERIGSGGYGEVWRAIAPGGIAKAIKVVHGCQDDQRATRELTSLNRIKEARHPFLLSLDRIELIDSHLIIVTELATSNLKRLFEQHRESGLSGIPRAVLLMHLRDAADALDYICQEHSLQHLDIKPENLLLVGGRIKVADFGLVKDLQDVHCSIVGGLTPVYAAPELFDGRPNDRSDQYSLAIVYQEMLTGSLPFEGRTTAQLAAQHLHSKPRLDCLPAADQPAIAKALSKRPEQRFSSCREMVDQLLEATQAARSRTTTFGPAIGGHISVPNVGKTEVLPHLAGAAEIDTARSQPDYATQPEEPIPAVCDLPPFELTPADVDYRPTIFIGIGGLAALTLQSLQRKLLDRFGDLRSAPALQFLLFDTDAETLQQVTEGEGPALLNNDAAIFLPLRQPSEYRRDSANHLQWLSRRWIFNIPRSLQTQGFRPLGRLAFADHSQRVAERIERTISAAVDPDSLAASAQRTGLPFHEGPPRVFIVSSISGGTGSGMVLDVAYLVRKVLKDLGLSAEGICGMLAHCTGRNSRARDLAVASAYAFLAELQHYSNLQYSYPGDTSCGLPAFANHDAPFESTYVVHLGEELEPEGFAAAADRLGEYLYRSAVTPAVAFFDKCHKAQAAVPAGANPLVRTFGLCQMGFSANAISAAQIDELCGALMMRWRGVERAEPVEQMSLAQPNSLLAKQIAAGTSEDELRRDAISRAQTLKLDVAQIAGQLHAVATRELRADLDSYLQTVLEELVSSCQSGLRGPVGLPTPRLIVDTLDTLIRSHGAKNAQRVCLESVLERNLDEMAARHAAALQEWIQNLIASPRHRVGGAQRAAGYIADYLRSLGRKASEALERPTRELRALEEMLLNHREGGQEWLRMGGFGRKRKLVADPRLLQYFRLRIEELTLNGVGRLSAMILAQITSLDDKLRNLTADLERVAEEFKPPQFGAGRPSSATAAEGVDRAMAEMIDVRKAELVAAMDHELEDALRRIATIDENYVRRALPQALRSAARYTVLRELKRITSQEIATGHDSQRATSPFSLASGLSAATPRLSNCGGARRLLLVAPEEVPSARLAEQLGDDLSELPTVIVDAQNNVLVCFEVEQLALRRVAMAVLDGRYQNVEVASRLHTRVDVAWSPL